MLAHRFSDNEKKRGFALGIAICGFALGGMGSRTIFFFFNLSFVCFAKTNTSESGNFSQDLQEIVLEIGHWLHSGN